MKSITRGIILSVALAFCTIFVLLLLSLGKTDKVSDFKRVFNHTAIIGNSFFTPVYPEDFRIYRDSIYILDFKENQIICSTISGKYCRKIGRTGTLPGEFQLILSYDIDSTGLYISDAKKHSITHLSPGGALVSQYPNQIFTREIHIGGDSFLFRGIYDSGFQNQQFVIKDLRAGKSTFIGPGMPVYNDGGLSTDGFFMKNKDGSFFYISYYTRNMLKFDQRGSLLFAANAIDAREKGPRAALLRKGVYTLEENIKPVHRYGCSSPDYLYIMSRAKSYSDPADRGRQDAIVDTYSTVNGSYLFSFILPSYKGTAAVKIQPYKDGLFVLYEDYFVYYNIRKRELL